MAESSKFSFSTGDTLVDGTSGLYSQPEDSAAVVGTIGTFLATGATYTLGSVAITGSITEIN
jgi:hypothetical protein